MTITKLHVIVAVLAGLGMSAGSLDRLAWAADPLLLNLLADRTADIPEPPPGKVALRLSLAYTPEPLPGAGIEFYEASPEVDSLWAMESLPKGESLPVGARISDGVVFLAPGEERMVTIAFRNPTSAEVGLRKANVTIRSSPGARNRTSSTRRGPTGSASPLGKDSMAQRLSTSGDAS